MNRLDGQTAVVTGASSGIGTAVALALAEEGAHVCINYYSGQERAEAVLAEVEKLNGKGMIFKADVSKPADVEAMFKKTIDTFGTVDILVSNSGIQIDAPLLEMTYEDWQKVIHINLTGQFLCGQAAAREFVRRGVVEGKSKAAGKIICMSSVHDIIPWAGHVNYATAKGGIMMMMKTMAQELAPYKIRVNSISPGAIKTPINESVWEDPDAMKALLKLIPYNRIGEPHDIGKAAVWLASDESDYVTGTTLYVDGGMTLYPGFIGNG